MYINFNFDSSSSAYVPSYDLYFGNIKIRNLQGTVHSYDTKLLSAIIGIHNAVNLTAQIVGYDLSGGTFSSSISASVRGYDFRNLNASVFVKQTTSRDLNSFLHGFQSKNLQASIKPLIFNDLSADISLIQPGELSAYLNTIQTTDLPANIYSWQAENLNAYLNIIFAKDLSAHIAGKDDMYKNLFGRLKGYASEHRDLLSTIDGVTFTDLSAIIKSTYYKDITAYLYPVQPKDLQATIKVFLISDLQGTLVGEDYPYNLSASINSIGTFSDLQGVIACIKAYRDLIGTINSWAASSLGASINPTAAHILNAYLNAVGNSDNLYASIYPKMIRLTTVVKISTMEHSDLSGTINISCLHSDYRNLFASIDVKYKGELYAYIKAIQEFSTNTLSAKIGYTDSYITLDKFKLRINIYPSTYYTTDKLILNFTFLNTQLMLNAYIRGTLRYESLSANVSAIQIPKYTYEEPIKNREKVIETDYSGIFKSYQTVETSFKSVVREYYYNSDGGEAWKASRFEKWMLDVSAYLPANTALNLKRRLHRATVLYDLKKFNTVDEAVRFAIDYVTTYPKNDLMAIINGVGHFAYLNGTITPRYQRSDESGLGGMITSVGKFVLVATDDGIIKI